MPIGERWCTVSLLWSYFECTYSTLGLNLEQMLPVLDSECVCVCLHCPGKAELRGWTISVMAACIITPVCLHAFECAAIKGLFSNLAVSDTGIDFFPLRE